MASPGGAPRGPVELRTSRLLLRAWRDADLDPFAAMGRDPEVMRWFPALPDRAASAAAIERFRRQHEEHGYTNWAVEVLRSERRPAAFVGYVGLSRPSFELPFAHTDPGVEVGWRLARAWWGIGVATEAARAALTHGFEVVGLSEVLSWTVPANLASQAVMQRIGMRYEGVFDHPRAAPGDWWGPHVLYRIDAQTHARSARP